MKCIVCDRCKTIIENPRKCRVITCARPLKPRVACENGKVPYRGNDPQQNDIIWEKEICDKCLDDLEVFFETGGSATPNPPEPDEPDPGTPDPTQPDPDTPGDSSSSGNEDGNNSGNEDGDQTGGKGGDDGGNEVKL